MLSDHLTTPSSGFLDCNMTQVIAVVGLLKGFSTVIEIKTLKTVSGI